MVFLKSLPYKILLSHTTYYGWFGQEYDPNPYQFSGILDLVIPQDVFKLPFDVSASFAFDAGTYRPPKFWRFFKHFKNR